MERVRLAEARYSEGWSQEKVAESIGVTRNTVSQWERGVTDPHPIYVHRLCQFYRKTAAELDLGGRQEEKIHKENPEIKKSGSDPSLNDTLEDESDPDFQRFSQTIAKSLLQAFAELGIQSVDSLHQQLGKRDMDRSRRLLFQVFSTSVAALLGLSHDTEPEINILQSWDQQVFFEQQLAALWDTYHTGGTAQADYKLKILLTNYERSLRSIQATELLCMSYQLQGSLSRDMMKYDDAHVFYQQAFEAAKELDDAELMSAALARRGVTLIQQNKATAAIAYLSEAHALIKSRTLPCLSGYIFQALSEAYAIAQQEHESKYHIDVAQQVLSNRGKVPERSHCQANTTSVTAQMGVNAVHLHNYVAAITLIEQGMENYNPTLVRGRARLKAQQAEAYYGLGDIRACCQSATEAWLLARAASSNKTFARLRNLQRDLVVSPQKKEPEVVDLNWVMTTL
ncbi:MAG: helix-turn-helix transcriptional regulator [Chloroflexota bacterium]|nr:helix-turn-helix transcriptional regulator [Chloroflexota bacterium]